MKNVIIVLVILLAHVFLSYSLPGGGGDRFIGTWKVLQRNRPISTIVISKKGTTYNLSYHYAWGQTDERTIAFRYQNDSLLGVNGFGYAHFIESSGHIKWNDDEWEKATEQPKE